MNYKSLDTLPMNVFLKILENPIQNIKLLSNSKINDLILKKRWIKLESQFNKLYNDLLCVGIPKDKVSQELFYLKTKFFIIDSSIKSMELMYNEDLAKVLLINKIEISKENTSIDLHKAKEINNAYIKYLEFLPENIESFDFIDYHACWCLILNKFENLNEISVKQYLNNYTEGINKIRLLTTYKN